MARTLIIIYGITLLLGWSLEGHAIRQYRCSGRVQYHPCDPTEESGPTRSMMKPLQKSSPKLYASIMKAELVKRHGQEGYWRGRVAGNGLVELTLETFRSGRLYEQRSMGSVALKNKESWFAYKAPYPAGSGWSWKISARALPFPVG